MNDKEEENSGTEFESDSDIYSASDKEQCISLALKTQATLKAFVSHNILYESYKT